ncbi:tetratricopeptide repeat protein [bacterium]|nr:tetratricopeptide repeat protein [bacterium]
MKKKNTRNQPEITVPKTVKSTNEKVFSLRREGIVCLVLIIATLAVYGQARHFDFTNYDDNKYVTENYSIRNGLNPESISWAFTTGYAANWHPLTWISHMVDYSLYGLGAGGHHITSVLFHVANTLLLFLVLRLMTGAFWQSAVVAAFFALHPLHVESVAWISERKDVLSAFFWMLTLLAYYYYTVNPGIKRYLPVALCFSLGFLSKPMVVTLPFALLLLDYWPLGRLKIGQYGMASAPKINERIHSGKRRMTPGQVLIEKIPLFFLSALFSFITYFVQEKGGAIQASELFPFRLRFENAIVSYIIYMYKTIWPFRLSVFYPHPGESLKMWQVMGSAALLVIVTVLIIRSARRYPFLVTGWLWFLGILVPVIGLVQVGIQALADRYTYIPIIGLFIMAAWGIPECMKRWNYRNIALSVVTGVLVTASTAAAWVQTGYWRDSSTLFRHAVDVTSNNYLAHNNLGAFLEERKEHDEAIRHFEEALRINPDYPDANNNLGVLLNGLGRSEEAMDHFSRVLRVNPNHARAHNNMGSVLDGLGRHDEAAVHFLIAIDNDPGYINAYNNYGISLERQGKLDEATAQFLTVLRLEPFNAEAHNNLGSVCLRQGKIDAAISHYKEALGLKPDYPEALVNLGSIMLQQGRLDDALNYCNEALRLNPDYADAYYNLGNVYARQGRFDDACSRYYDALRLKPDHAEAQMNLGNVFYSGRGNLDSAYVHYSEALRLKPDYPEAHNNLGSLLFSRGNIGEAARHFSEAVRLKPDYEEARQNLEHIRALIKK